MEDVMYCVEFLLVCLLVKVVGIKSVIQVYDGRIFVLHGVVGCERDNGVRECGFSKYGGCEVCMCSVY